MRPTNQQLTNEKQVFPLQSTVVTIVSTAKLPFFVRWLVCVCVCVWLLHKNSRISPLFFASLFLLIACFELSFAFQFDCFDCCRQLEASNSSGLARQTNKRTNGRTANNGLNEPLVVNN